MHMLLDDGGTILTANARAARALHRRHAEQQLESHVTAWRTPQILDLDSWLAEQWQALLLTGSEERVLLNAAQEQALWERTITPTLAGRSLISPARMTALSQQSYALLCAHDAVGRLEDPAWAHDANAERELFRTWARAVRRECQRRGWVPHSELIHVIAASLRDRKIPAPQQIGWLGFDRHTPAQNALMSALEDAGCVCRVLAFEVGVAAPRLYRAVNDTEEAAACAEWVRAHLASRPEQRIGILAPELGTVRTQLERALFRALAPESFPIMAGMTSLPFEFATGTPIAETPLGRAAVLLLRWLMSPLPQQDITWLLLSSTLGTLQGRVAREAAARWDASVRRASCAPPEMALDAWLQQSGIRNSAVGPLREQLHRMQSAFRRYRGRATASVWVERIEELLSLAGWGIVANPSSLIFQVRESWGALLESVASLEYDGRSYAYPELLEVLEQLAAETIFAPESHDAPVQVMGALAAAGQLFDRVWFLSASNGRWPTSGRPHPLLPLALQRELQMPHASPSIDTELTHRVTARILANADEVVFSFAEQDAEAVMQQPSPLLVDLAAYEADPAALPQPASVRLEEVVDESWVAHPHPQTAQGGHGPLKRQANCPFQAFAQDRLHLRELPIAGRGLSPATRGTLLHEVMQRVWSEDAGTYAHLEDRASLRAAAMDGTLRPLVAQHVAAAIAALNVDRSVAWQRAYLAAEQARLIELSMDWLEFEATRQEFRVAAVEKKIDVQVGELALSVRADRIDEVSGGSILIDYKTGEVGTNGWEGDRPEEPQLPLYATFGEVQHLAGALFAQVRQGKMEFKGRVKDPQVNLLQSLNRRSQLLRFPYSDELVTGWRESLTVLAANFVRGEAKVDPRHYPKSCQYCALPGLCRVAESPLVRIEEEDEDEEEPA